MRGAISEQNPVAAAALSLLDLNAKRKAVALSLDEAKFKSLLDSVMLELGIEEKHINSVAAFQKTIKSPTTTAAMAINNITIPLSPTSSVLHSKSNSSTLVPPSHNHNHPVKPLSSTTTVKPSIKVPVTPIVNKKK